MKAKLKLLQFTASEPKVETKLICRRESQSSKLPCKYSAPPELQTKQTSLFWIRFKGVDPRFIVAIARKESSFCKTWQNCQTELQQITVRIGISEHDDKFFVNSWLDWRRNHIYEQKLFSRDNRHLWIEKTYTPPAKGVWCQAINEYISEMQ